MTFLEAVNRVETDAYNLGLSDRMVGRLRPAEALGVVARQYHQESEMIIGEMERLEITPSVYREKWNALFERFKKDQFIQRLEDDLKKLQKL